jgi:predicted ATPase
LEAERLGVGRRIELPALSIDEVREAVERATRGEMPEEWLTWVVGQSRGVPGTLWSTLGALERGGTLRLSGRRWSWEGNPDEAVGGRTQATVDVSGLDDEDMRILSIAAVEGHRFHSSVLAELSGVPELDLDDRLSRLCRRGLLEYCGEVAAGADVTSSYAFRSPSDANVFASGCPDADRPALTARIQSIYQRLGLPADLD